MLPSLSAKLPPSMPYSPNRKVSVISGAIRAIAFHLPQFHPIPENDEWWGKGFTEWTNVVKAKPLFKGHYQPHLPADLGFYDLRVPETRAAQAMLAASHGIHGFCYYHYWFNGRQVLERPVNEILKSDEPDFPFCLCWANENWTRQWDGLESDVLLQQKYSSADDLAHIRHLIPFFQDRRYIRVSDRPLFLVYRASDHPEPERMTEIWRQEAERAGLKGCFSFESNVLLMNIRGSPRQNGFRCRLGVSTARNANMEAHLSKEMVAHQEIGDARTGTAC